MDLVWCCIKVHWRFSDIFHNCSNSALQELWRQSFCELRRIIGMLRVIYRDFLLVDFEEIKLCALLELRCFRRLPEANWQQEHTLVSGLVGFSHCRGRTRSLWFLWHARHYLCGDLGTLRCAQQDFVLGLRCGIDAHHLWKVLNSFVWLLCLDEYTHWGRLYPDLCEYCPIVYLQGIGCESWYHILLRCHSRRTV